MFQQESTISARACQVGVGREGAQDLLRDPDVLAARRRQAIRTR